MTDQTVPVPISELVALRDGITNWDTVGPLAAVLALIPTPPKVGDVLTAAQIRELPITSVVIDAEGDAWVKHVRETLYLAMDGSGAAMAFDDGYAPYTLVYLAPRD